MCTAAGWRAAETEEVTGAAAVLGPLHAGGSLSGVAAAAASPLLTLPPALLPTGSQTTGGHAIRSAAVVALSALPYLMMMAISLLTGYVCCSSFLCPIHKSCHAFGKQALTACVEGNGAAVLLRDVTSQTFATLCVHVHMLTKCLTMILLLLDCGRICSVVSYSVVHLLDLPC